MPITRRSATLAAAVIAAVGAVFAAPRPACAQLLQVFLQSATLTTTPGGTVGFSGRITNNSGGTVMIRGSGFSQVAPQLFPDDSPFFNAIPDNGLSLANGASFPAAGFTSLFDIAVAPDAAPGQTYRGTFEVLGGPNANDANLLGFQDFFVNISAVAIPEPGSAALFVLAFGAAAFVGGVSRRRCRRREEGSHSRARVSQA